MLAPSSVTESRLLYWDGYFGPHGLMTPGSLGDHRSSLSIMMTIVMSLESGKCRNSDPRT